MTQVLITVPHGAPGNDATAPAVGRAIHEELRHLGIDSRLLISRCCRYDRADMNRPEGRGAQFRRRVAEVVERDRPALLLDVHSFPNDYARFQGEDITLLRSCQEEEFLREYARGLHETALEMMRPITVGVLPSAYPNDVCAEAVELGHPTSALVLAEHRDGGDPELFGSVHAQVIARTLGEAIEAPAWAQRLMRRPWYRGTTDPEGGGGLGVGFWGRGLYLTWDRSMAEAFARMAAEPAVGWPPRKGTQSGGTPYLVTYIIRPQATLRILDGDSKEMHDIKAMLGVSPWDKIDSPMFASALTDETERAGYDGIISSNKADGIVLFNPKDAKRIKVERLDV